MSAKLFIDAILLTDGIKIGDVISVDAGTSPTKSGYCKITGKVVAVFKSGSFQLSESDPYFGYTIFKQTDIILN